MELNGQLYDSAVSLSTK